MDYIDFLIKLVCFVLIGGILWWMLNLVPLPQPIKIAVYAICGIIAILIIADVGGLGHGHSVFLR